MPIWFDLIIAALILATLWIAVSVITNIARMHDRSNHIGEHVVKMTADGLRMHPQYGYRPHD